MFPLSERTHQADESIYYDAHRLWCSQNRSGVEILSLIAAIRGTGGGCKMSLQGNVILSSIKNDSIKPDWITTFIRARRAYRRRIPGGDATRKYEEDQQIPTAIIILFSSQPFSRCGETVRVRSGKLSSGGGADGKNRGRSIILRSFPVAANLARARAHWVD